jgi:hypothetical protein
VTLPPFDDELKHQSEYVVGHQAVTTGLWTGLTLLALGEAWLGITLAYYPDWPVSFCDHF